MRELVWNAQSERIEIRFPFDRRLVALVRELTGRRWHPEEKIWSAPRESLPEVARLLLPQGFTACETVRALLDDPEAASVASGSSGSPPGGPEQTAEGSLSKNPVAEGSLLEERVAEPGPIASGGDEAETWTVSNLNERVRQLLRDRLPFPFWVVGEVVGFDRNAHKSHVFFSLVEKVEGDDSPRATVTAVLFSRSRAKVERTLAEAGGGIAMQDGIRVRLRVSVDFYPRTGSFQIIVEEVDPTFTLGEIALRQERILRQVREAGLAERNLELPFPVPPLRVGLMTSVGSDAYNDFLEELGRSGFAFRVTVADVHVQGERLEPEVLAAFDRFSRRSADFDVLVVTRGGGSRTDLMGFDTPLLAFAVARHPLKILIGIGHHQDRSVLDLIAHSEKTPTASAQHLVALCSEEEARLRRAGERVAAVLARVVALERGQIRLREERLQHSGRQRVESERRWIEGAGRSLAEGGPRITARSRQHLREAGLRVAAGLAARLSDARSRLLRDRDRVPRSAARALERTADRLAAARQDLPRRAVPRLEKLDGKLSLLRERILARDPRQVLARGYAWLVRPDGRSISRVAGVEEGEAFTARLRDGSLRGRVEGVDLSPPDSSAAE